MVAPVNASARRLRGVRHYAALLVAEHNNKTLDRSTMHAVAAASRLPGVTSLDLLVSGKGCGSVALEASTVEGVTKVLLAESDQLEHRVAETMSELLLALQATSQYVVIAGPTSSSVRDSLPRVAAKLDVQPVSDIISVESEDGVMACSYAKTYAGNAIARVKTSDAVRVLTFRATAFEPRGVASSAAPVESVQTAAYDSTGAKWLSESVKASDKPQLGSADRVVSGGRALQSAENFDQVLQPPVRQVECRHGRLARGGGCWPRAERVASGADGQGRCTQTLPGCGHQWCHSASCRHKGFEDHRRGEQGSRRTHLSSR